MPRIRVIKPEFWTDKKASRLSRDARLLFIGLWNFADDNGVLEGDLFQLKLRIFPADPDITEEVIQNLLEEMKTLDLLREYEHGGERYIWIVDFSRYQRKPDRPRKNNFPLPDEVRNNGFCQRSLAPESPESPENPKTARSSKSTPSKKPEISKNPASLGSEKVEKQTESRESASLFNKGNSSGSEKTSGSEKASSEEVSFEKTGSVQTGQAVQANQTAQTSQAMQPAQANQTADCGKASSEAAACQTRTMQAANQPSTTPENTPLTPENPGLLPETQLPPETASEEVSFKETGSVQTGQKEKSNQDQREKPESDEEETLPPGISPCPHQEIVALYHEILPEWPRVRKLTTDRKRRLRERWREVLTDPELAGAFNLTVNGKPLDRKSGLTWFKSFFSYIRESDFLMGRTERSSKHQNWRPDFDWILHPKKFVNIVEGKYHSTYQPTRNSHEKIREEDLVLSEAGRYTAMAAKLLLEKYRKEEEAKKMKSQKENEEEQRNGVDF